MVYWCDSVPGHSLQELKGSPSLPSTHILGPEHRFRRPLQVPHLQCIFLPACGDHMGTSWILPHPTHPRAHAQFQKLTRGEGIISRVLILPPLKPSSGTCPAQGSLTGSGEASLSLSRQTRRIPESTHVMREL